jgi:hypothetical protein
MDKRKEIEPEILSDEEYEIANQLDAICQATDIEDLNHAVVLLAKLIQRLHRLRGKHVDQKEAREQARVCFYVCQIFKMPEGQRKEEAMVKLNKIADRQKQQSMVKESITLIKGGRQDEPKLKSEFKL